MIKSLLLTLAIGAALAGSMTAAALTVGDPATGTFDLGRSKRRFDPSNQELGGITPGEKFDLRDFMRDARFDGAETALYKAFVVGKDETEIARLKAAARTFAPTNDNFDDIVRQLRQKADAARQRTWAGGGR